MQKLSDLEHALQQLPVEKKREIAQWLWQDLHANLLNSCPPKVSEQEALRSPDYASRRRRIFGDQVLPNMVLENRAQDPW
jgi:hypothetical protein